MKQVTIDALLTELGAPLDQWPDHSVPDGVSVCLEEGRALSGIAYALGGPVLEIGSYNGVSTRFIAEGLARRGDGGVVYAVDPQHRWAATDWFQIRQLHGRAEELALPPCRWALIDPDHDYVSTLVALQVALRAGCEALVFHDTAPHLPTPENMSYARAAALANLRAPRWELWDIQSPCGLLLARRTVQVDLAKE